MSYVKHLEIIGGEYSGGNNDDDKKKNASPRVFVERHRKDGSRARVVILESDLAFFFRRDWEMAGMGTVRITETTSPLTEPY